MNNTLAFATHGFWCRVFHSIPRFAPHYPQFHFIMLLTIRTAVRYLRRLAGCRLEFTPFQRLVGRHEAPQLDMSSTPRRWRCIWKASRRHYGPGDITDRLSAANWRQRMKTKGVESPPPCDVTRHVTWRHQDGGRPRGVYTSFVRQLIIHRKAEMDQRKAA